MTPADPVWLLAEILAGLARMVRDQRRQRAERRRMAALLPSTPRRQALLGAIIGPARSEPEQLPDILYARVQAALVEFARRRDLVVQHAGVSRALSWQVHGREVTVSENNRPLFRARWSALEDGWRLFWTRNSERWWPHVGGSHLSIGSFESCVREVERDPRRCFPPTESQIQN